ncbi:MAG: magnesium/cobalt transporter CorA [Desulfobacterales bacterium]|nr:magnesium/cobalt transporter CorA [Desulfobacterales bacterium]
MKNIPNVMLYFPDQDQLKSGGPEIVNEWRQSDQGVLWLDFYQFTSEEELQSLGQDFSVHPLAIADALRDRHPPRIESFDDHTFVLLRGFSGEPENFQFNTIQLALFIGERYLLTRRSGPSPSIELLREEVKETPSMMAKGADSLAVRLSRIMAGRYLRLLLNLEVRLEEIEDEMLSDPTDTILAELIGYKSELTKFRRIFHYHAQILGELKSARLPGFSERIKPYIVDSYEQQERASSLATLYYDMASDLVDGYISLASHRLNNIMKLLTIVSVIFVPLSFLAGLYGMNFEYIPELRFASGYFVLLAVMALIILTLLTIFRRKNWL